MSEAQNCTPPEELQRQIMSHSEPKNEREWWACHRIERLEAALRECEMIVKRRQDENVRKTEWEGSKLAQAKARATATRCGMILGELRKHIRAALAGEKKDD